MSNSQSLPFELGAFRDESRDFVAGDIRIPSFGSALLCETMAGERLQDNGGIAAMAEFVLLVLRGRCPEQNWNAEAVSRLPLHVIQGIVSWVSEEATNVGKQTTTQTR
ncbi:MAG: hypothetical protein HC910_22800 [Spirulinaceae cyanobacterium SM2_1_0]|nr:hypothetical protein [Spirulinaceae cyanobacterium SM2_1_0]